VAALRVTQQILVDRTLNNLSEQSRRILQIQEQLSTGRRVVNVSDDPLAARLGVNTRTRINQNEQFVKNINFARPPLAETATNLMNLIDVVQRARELTLRAGNDSLQQPELDAVAEEIDELLEQSFNIGNHITNNRYLFAGTRSTNPAFSATRNAQGEITSVTFEGNDEAVRIAISEGVQVQINEPGTEVFRDQVDIHQLLIDIRGDMRAGDTNALRDVRIGELNSANEQLLSAVARVGATQNRVEAVSNNTQDFNLRLEETLSDAIDADFARTITELNAQNNAFQAALNATARVIQPSLLDFVR